MQSSQRAKPDYKTLGLFIERYVSRRYHLSPMHSSQYDILLMMASGIRNEQIDTFDLDVIKDVVRNSPFTAAGIFGNYFLDEIDFEN